jgi:inorganic pyrophosphatase
VGESSRQAAPGIAVRESSRRRARECRVWTAASRVDWQGVVIPSSVIGVVKMHQRDKKGPRVQNDRIIAVPCDDPRYKDVRELPRCVREELETFFVTVIEMTDKKVTIEGWEGPKSAEKLIDQVARHYIRGGAEPDDV